MRTVFKSIAMNIMRLEFSTGDSGNNSCLAIGLVIRLRRRIKNAS